MSVTFAQLVVESKCGACQATGHYHHTKSGAPVRTSLPCYRCGGKGYQTTEDARRNAAYDRFAAQRMVA